VAPHAEQGDKTFDIELLARLDPVHMPKFGRQHNLAFG
jgi:hypothetical protein